MHKPVSRGVSRASRRGGREERSREDKTEDGPLRETVEKGRDEDERRWKGYY